ncbi:MAG TPA: restriction endonuclease [Chloroflexota bacterium]|nr:restriction endonuclease [Chloroflexota bacterium]HUM70434.1 restriction endonuclease [Chloroflexota bacterium]
MTILSDWEITPEQLTELLKENPSLRGMLLGYVAELKLKELVTSLPGVSYTMKFDDHDRKKKGDLYIIYQGKAFDLESKSLQSNMIKWDEQKKRWMGKAQVDASDRRTISLPDGSTLTTTLLLRGEFDILAVNCYAFEQRWRFVFARNSDLPSSTYASYTEYQQKFLVASLIPVTWPPEPPFYANLNGLLDDMIANGEGTYPANLSQE